MSRQGMILTVFMVETALTHLKIAPVARKPTDFQARNKPEYADDRIRAFFGEKCDWLAAV